MAANKALLAAEGFDLFSLARRRNVRALQHGLAGDSIQSIAGIVNGTCNYILTRMEDDVLSFDDALQLAQQRGFAEADPTLDVEGEDAAQKLRILASVAFDAPVRSLRVHGIRDVTRAEVEGARSRRCVVRHVASARHIASGVELRVERRELPEQHPLATIKDENNAVLVRGRAVGEMLFAGKGAGSLPTAAAVLSDVLELVV